METRWNVTGTKHGTIIHAKTEGEARKIFHIMFKGESIISCSDTSNPKYWNRIISEQQKLDNGKD